MNILLGEISSYKAIVIARFLKRNYKEAFIYTYDKKRRSNYIRSKYSDKHLYVNPKYFEKEIQSIIVDHKIDFFFPVINNSLSILLKDKSKYGKSLNYIENIHSYNILNNKFSLHTIAEKLNIRVPKLYPTIEAAKIPFVVKPTNLSSAIGVKYVFTESDILNVNNPIKEDNNIIQEYVTGVGVGYSFYCNKGKIVHGYGHRRLAEYPATGGSSTYRTYYHNNLMHEYASLIVEEVNYTGFAMFEFKLTKNNELFLLEVNPRIWGSINQGMADGNVNYFEEILGPSTSKKINQKRNVNTYISPLINLSILQYIFKLKFKPLSVFVSNFFRNKPDVSIFSDPTGYVSTILRKL